MLPPVPMTLRAMIMIAAVAASGCHSSARTTPTEVLAEQRGSQAVEAAAHSGANGRSARIARCTADADYDQLFAELERWTTAEPDRPAGWLALSQWLMDPDVPCRLRCRETALAAANRALQVCAAPDPTLLITLGTARYRLNDVGGAVAAYQAALRAPGKLDCRAELEALILELR